MRWAVVSLYMGGSGKQGFYNSQEVGPARAMSHRGYECYILIPCTEDRIREERAEDGIVMVYVPARVFDVNVKYDWSVLSEYKIDVVQINCDNRIFAYSAIRYCGRYGILCYTYFGTLESDSKSLSKRGFMRFFSCRNLSAMKCHKNFANT